MVFLHYKHWRPFGVQCTSSLMMSNYLTLSFRINEYQLWREARKLSSDSTWCLVHRFRHDPQINLSFLLDFQSFFAMEKTFLLENYPTSSRTSYILKRMLKVSLLNLPCVLLSNYLFHNAAKTIEKDWHHFWTLIAAAISTSVGFVLINTIFCHCEKFFYREEVMNFPDQKQVEEHCADCAECRVCHEDDSMAPLIAPCRCCGTIKFIHEECLDNWRRTSQKNATYCSVCQTTYKIGRRYKTWSEMAYWLLLQAAQFVILTDVWHAWLRLQIVMCTVCFILSRCLMLYQFKLMSVV